MSQQSHGSSFLEEVVSWNRQTCCDNLDTALPAVISELESSGYGIPECIGILKIICDSFLPCVPLEELEVRVFSRVSKQVTGLVDSALNMIESTVKGAAPDISQEIRCVVLECLEGVAEVVSCLETCIKQTLSVPSAVQLSSVQSLPACSLHCLKQAYTHCRQSSDLYGGHLQELMGQALTDLFRRTHSLQMVLVSLLNRICVSGARLEEHVQILCSVCTGLFEVCNIVYTLDEKLVISLWKALARVCSQHIALLQDRLDVCPFVNLLCGEIRQGYTYLFQLYPGADPDSLSQGDEKAFIKSSKILGFQMKVLVALLRDYGNYLGTCESSILDLLLCIHRCLPPSLSARQIPTKLEEEVRTQLVNATAPILGHLMGSRAFRAALLAPSTEECGENKLPRLLLQLMVFDLLPGSGADVVSSWLISIDSAMHQGLLSAVFQSVHKCEVEMRVPVMLPGVMVAGKPQRNVSLYEHVATHLSGFIGACPATHFHVLEMMLLKNVVADNYLCSLLAADCWCFLARYGTADTCRDQVQTLVVAFKHLSKSGKESAAVKLVSLIRRLINFMSPEHQSALVSLLSPDNDPNLWAVLGVRCLNSDLATSVGQKLVNWALTLLQKTTIEASELLQACKLLAQLLEGIWCAGGVTTVQQSWLVDWVSSTWGQLHANRQLGGSARIEVVAGLLQLTQHMLPVLEAGDLLRILSVVQYSLEGSRSWGVALVAANFLLQFGSVRLASGNLQTQILNKLPELFHSLLTHPHPLVHHRALAAFIEFASQTVHVEVIPACVQGNEELGLRLEQFHNKIRFQSSKKKFVLVEFLRRVVDSVDAVDCRMSSETGGNSGCEDRDMVTLAEGGDDSEELPAKRARLIKDAASPAKEASSNESAEITVAVPREDNLNTRCQNYLDILSGLARNLEEVGQTSARLPDWFVQAARETLTRINTCLSPSDTWLDHLS